MLTYLSKNKFYSIRNHISYFLVQDDLKDQDYQRVFNHERESRYGSEYFGSEREDHDGRNDSPGVTPEHPHLRSYERPYEHMSPEARREFLDRYLYFLIKCLIIDMSCYGFRVKVGFLKSSVFTP